MPLFELMLALTVFGATPDEALSQERPEWPIQSDPFEGQEVTRIEVGSALPRRELLTPGVRHYLRYTIKGGHRSALDLWTRRIEHADENGRAVLRMSMDWDQASAPGRPGSRMTQVASFDAHTLAPLSHWRQLEREGEEQTTLYRYEGNQVVATVEQGTQETPPAVPMPTPAYNFEYDMELFQTLDWEAHPVVDLYFYDPGYDPPASYRFGVVGEDVRMGANGERIECWIIASDYNSGEFNKRMWVSKATQIVVHEEAVWNGMTFIKTLIGNESGDAPGL